VLIAGAGAIAYGLQWVAVKQAASKPASCMVLGRAESRRAAYTGRRLSEILDLTDPPGYLPQLAV